MFMNTNLFSCAPQNHSVILYCIHTLHVEQLLPIFWFLTCHSFTIVSSFLQNTTTSKLISPVPFLQTWNPCLSVTPLPTMTTRWHSDKRFSAWEKCHVCPPSWRSVQHLGACPCRSPCQALKACQLLPDQLPQPQMLLICRLMYFGESYVKALLTETSQASN